MIQSRAALLTVKISVKNESQWFIMVSAETFGFLV